MEEIIAEQADLIARLQAEVVALREGLGQARARLHGYERGTVEDRGLGRDPDPYWEGVYNDIRAAWDAWAFAELGTATPSELDLAGRPELQALWDAVK